MSVRAKFKLNRVERSIGSRVKKDADGNRVKNSKGYDEMEPCEMHTLVLNPVYGNGDPDHENTKFWDASPGGELKLNCVNAAAVGQFVLGAEYYVDFTPAGGDAPGRA